jgi:hypothetical protein
VPVDRASAYRATVCRLRWIAAASASVNKLRMSRIARTHAGHSGRVRRMSVLLPTYYADVGERCSPAAPAHWAESPYVLSSTAVWHASRALTVEARGVQPFHAVLRPELGSKAAAAFTASRVSAVADIDEPCPKARRPNWRVGRALLCTSALPGGIAAGSCER